jgi:hypothetical protein
MAIIELLMDTNESENELTGAAVFQPIVNLSQCGSQPDLVNRICFHAQGKALTENP